MAHLLRVASHSQTNRMQIHNIAIMFGPALFCDDNRTNVRTKGNATIDKKAIAKKKADKKGVSSSVEASSSEPNQNLAYKMIVYGQIVEYILKEFSRFVALQFT